jgi:hypothetical protein
MCSRLSLSQDLSFLVSQEHDSALLRKRASRTQRALSDGLTQKKNDRRGTLIDQLSAADFVSTVLQLLAMPPHARKPTEFCGWIYFD